MNNDRTVHIKPELSQSHFLVKNGLILMAILLINLPLFFYFFYFTTHPNSLLDRELIMGFLLGIFTVTFFLLLEKYQLDQKILLATKVLNLYFNEGKFLQTPNRYSGTIDKLFQAIEHGIHHCEDQLLDLKIESSIPQPEEIFKLLFQKEIAEDRLRQCLSIATRYQLPLCIALIKIEGLKFNGVKELSSAEPQILELAQQLTEILRGSDWAVHWGDNEFLLTIFSEVEGTKIALERISESLNHPEHLTSNFPQTLAPLAIGFTQVQRNEHYLACVDRANQALQKAQAINQSCVYL